MNRIYLDHNASSPLRPEVQEALKRFLTLPGANPSSVHGRGRKMRMELDRAREIVAKYLGANPSEIIFTSGGTEANHLAWQAFSLPGTSILTSKVEHPCVFSAAQAAKARGATLEFCEQPSSAREFYGNYPFLSLQSANHETGIFYDAMGVHKEEISSDPKATIHRDCVQSFGKVSRTDLRLNSDLISLSGHKIGALSGIGVLYVRKGCPFSEIWQGGQQERGRRPGTENLIGIISLAAALEIAGETESEEITRIRNLRNSFEAEVKQRISDVSVTGENLPRLPNTSHLRFEGADGESLLIALDLAGVDASLGAACSSGSLEPSPVLLAMGWTPHAARQAIRFSLGWNTTENEIESVMKILPRLVDQVRSGPKKEAKR